MVANTKEVTASLKELLGQRQQTSPSAVAMAWAIRDPNVHIIPKSAHADRIASNLRETRALAPHLSDDEMVSFVLESQPVGLALVESSATTFGLLLEGSDTLLQVDLANPSQPVEIGLAAPPTGIGALPDGRFWILWDGD